MTIEFPKKREEYMGYCESAVGVGLMIGPVLGSAVFGLCGYAKTFYVFGTVIALGLVCVFFLLPSRLNHVGAAKAQVGVADETEDQILDAPEGLAAS